jgi:hypothetical protein
MKSHSVWCVASFPVVLPTAKFFITQFICAIVPPHTFVSLSCFEDNIDDLRQAYEFFIIALAMVDANSYRCAIFLGLPCLTC